MKHFQFHSVYCMFKDVLRYTLFPFWFFLFFIFFWSLFCFSTLICYLYNPSPLHSGIHPPHRPKHLPLPPMYLDVPHTCPTIVQLQNTDMPWCSAHHSLSAVLHLVRDFMKNVLKQRIWQDTTDVLQPATSSQEKNINEQCSSNTYSATYMKPWGTQAPCPQSTLTGQGEVWCKDKEQIHCFKQITETIYSKQSKQPALSFKQYITSKSCSLEQ